MKHLFTLLMKTSSQLQRVCSKGLTSIILTIGALLITNVPIQAQNSSIPSPESILGFKVGADFKLASYEESLDYFQKLEASSEVKEDLPNEEKASDTIVESNDQSVVEEKIATSAAKDESIEEVSGKESEPKKAKKKTSKTKAEDKDPE